MCKFKTWAGSTNPKARSIASIQMEKNDVVTRWWLVSCNRESAQDLQRKLSCQWELSSAPPFGHMQQHHCFDLEFKALAVANRRRHQIWAWRTLWFQCLWNSISGFRAFRISIVADWGTSEFADVGVQRCRHFVISWFWGFATSECGGI